MRLLLKLLALFIFGPMILGLIAIVGIVAVIGLPLLWDRIVSRIAAPREKLDDGSA